MNPTVQPFLDGLPDIAPGTGLVPLHLATIGQHLAASHSDLRPWLTTSTDDQPTTEDTQ